MARAADTTIRSQSNETDRIDRRLADIRGLVWEAFKKRLMSWSDIAAEAGLCTVTVEDFAFGITRRPHLNTVEALLEALGVETFYRLPNSKRYVQASSFASVSIGERPAKTRRK